MVVRERLITETDTAVLKRVETVSRYKEVITAWRDWSEAPITWNEHKAASHGKAVILLRDATALLEGGGLRLRFTHHPF